MSISTYGVTRGKYLVQWCSDHGARIEYFNSFQEITDWFRVVSGPNDASFMVNGRPYQYCGLDS